MHGRVKILRACLKIPERGCVVFDQPQHASNSRRVEELAMRCGWSSTQPRSFFRQALRKACRRLARFAFFPAGFPAPRIVNFI
jgi:hypothetical protein